MTDEQKNSAPERQVGRTYGWLSGLGIGLVPWLAAGIVSTFLPNPEASFPGALLAAFVSMVVWLIYGSVRIPAFRRGAVLGSLVAMGVVGILYLLVLAAQP